MLEKSYELCQQEAHGLLSMSGAEVAFSMESAPVNPCHLQRYWALLRWIDSDLDTSVILMIDEGHASPLQKYWAQSRWIDDASVVFCQVPIKMKSAAM